MYDINKIKEYLKENLSEYRYNHSLLVAEEAKLLAKNYNYDEEKAYIAGLVHDIAKEYSSEVNKEYIDKYNLSKDLLKEENKKIIHADIGSIVVKELYNMDEDISNAVLYHTLGNINMDTLAKIVFIADKIGRENTPNIDKYKKLAYKDLDLAIKTYLEDGKEILASRNLKQHKNTIELLNYLNNK